MKFRAIATYALIALLFRLAECAPANETDCAKLSPEETCCSQNGCMFFLCDTLSNSSLSECHASSWNSSDVCKAETVKENCTSSGGETTTQAPTVAPTTQPENMCSGKNQTECCQVKECQFINCTSSNNTAGEPIQGCFNNNTDLSGQCEADTEKDLCDSPVTSSTTASSTTTTPKPSDVCETYTDNTTCCSHAEDQKCQFIKCTALDNTVHTGCHAADANLSSVCKVDTKANTCAPGPATQSSTTTTTNTTKAPDANANTGNQEAQHFDGASFIGGFVLCLGIVAIIFFGLKFYKAKTERNYQTLQIAEEDLNTAKCIF